MYYANCVVSGNGQVLGYKVVNGRVETDESIAVDTTDLTDIFQNFSFSVQGSTYSGGEASAHSSCGYLCKKVGGSVVWILMSLEAGPFTAGEVISEGITFSSTSGSRWTFRSGDVEDVYVTGLPE